MTSVTKYADTDDFIVFTQPLYGFRCEEMVKKIEYLKQKLFWTKISNKLTVSTLVLHFMGICDIFGLSRNIHDAISWKEKFESTLDKHHITFKPGKVVYEDGIRDGLGRVDSHLCSGPKGDWECAGVGLKLISSQKEREKYMGMLNELFKINYQMFFDFQTPDHSDPEEMLRDLKYGFYERFEVDSVIFCCKNAYNQDLSSLRNEIEILEFHIFWTSINLFDTTLSANIAEHNLKFYQKNLKILTIQKKDAKTEWTIEFERILTSYNLTFAPGKPKRYMIGDAKTKIDNNICVHLCSGEDRGWFSGVGFGKLMVIDKSARERYIKFLEYIKTY